MSIQRTIDGKEVSIELTDAEKNAIYQEGVRKVKIKNTIVDVRACYDVDISGVNLSKEQQQLLVDMADSYQADRNSYGFDFNCKNSFNGFYKKLDEFFPKYFSIK